MKSITKAAALGLALALVVPAGALLAQDSPIEERQALMKENGNLTKTAGEMAQGKTEYDAAEAKAAVEGIAANAEEFPTLFPEGSETGFETRAKPEIWSDWDEFEEISAKLHDDALAASAAADEGLDAFKVAFGTMAGNCKACHDEYRAPK